MGFLNNKIRELKLICAVGSFVFIVVNTSNGASIDSKPSFWAEEKIRLATKDGLIADHLREDFRRPITREEYAELMLNLFKKTGKDIPTLGENPFRDIQDSKRIDILIQAYEIGFIKGYGNGLFKPYENITREQIAALLTAFVKTVAPTTDINPKNNYDFIDKKEIDSWALPMVNYCYESGIMKGPANLTIKPKASVTCEDSIILAYNLAEKFGIVKKVEEVEEVKKPVTTLVPEVDPTPEATTSTLPTPTPTPIPTPTMPSQNDIIPEGEKVIQGTQNLEVLKKNLGEANGKVVSQLMDDLTQNPKLENIFVLKDIVKIVFQDGKAETRIFMGKSVEPIDDVEVAFIKTGLRTTEPSNQSYLDTYLQLISTSKYKKEVTEAFNTAIKSIQEKKEISPVKLEFGKEEYFKIFSADSVNGMVYLFELHEQAE